MELHKALQLSSPPSSSSSHGHCYGRALSFHRHNPKSSSFSFPTPYTCKFPNTKLTLHHHHHHYYRRRLITAVTAKSSSNSDDNDSLLKKSPLAKSDEFFYRRRLIPAATAKPLSISDDNDSSAILPSLKKSQLAVFWEFLVPYALKGFVIFYISRFARVVVNNWPLLLRHVLSSSPAATTTLTVKLLSGLVCLVCCNMFTVGINQLYDIEIDKINKPYKPLPSGEMSVQTAWALTVSYVVLGLGIIAANKAEPWVVFTYCFNLLVLAVYSVPPIRFKRFPIFAPFMLGITHITGNFGVYHALKATLPFLPIKWMPAFAFIAIFHAIFFFVLGILKDIPDIEGDRKHGVFTPATALGPRKTVFLGSGILVLLYVGATVSAAMLRQSFNAWIMIPSHFVMAVVLIYRVWQLDKTKYAPNECEVFYRFLWSLVYLENFLFPFI